MLVDITHPDDLLLKAATYVDDFTAAAKIIQLRKWLNTKNQQYVADIFGWKSIKITTDGQRHLGAIFGSIEYKRTYIQEKLITGLRNYKCYVNSMVQASSSLFMLCYKI